MIKRLVSISLLILFLASCSTQGNNSEVGLTHVNVCYSALASTQTVVWYAFEKGLFEKYGLDVNLVKITGGSSAATALISGDMDICQVGATQVVNAVAAHQDLVIIAGLINIAPGFLVSQPEITSLEMIKGKIIGSDRGSLGESMIRLVLERNGIDPDKDVKWLSIPSTGDLAALKAKQIDLTHSSPPSTQKLLDNGFFMLLDIGSLKIPYQGTSIAVTRQYLAKNREVVTSFMKAILETIVRIKMDQDGSITVMSKYLDLDPVTDAEALKAAYTSILLNVLENVPYPTEEGLQVVINIAAKDNPDAGVIKPADLLDTSILHQLEESGFIKKLK